MTNTSIPSKLQIPETLAAGPGPGNTDARVLASFANAGLADHMHPDVLRGMIECKQMLREVWRLQRDQFWSADMSAPMASLPVTIFKFAMSPYENWQQLAWAGVFLITVAVLGLNILARFLTRQK